jgi:succinate dehydrogenase / fumarate reductase, iron-sulfur subunit
MDQFILKVLRGTPGKQYWEEFELPLEPRLNVIAALMEIQKNPVNKRGEQVSPVVWEQGCLEEVCGSCSMLINGRPRQACTAIIEQLLNTAKSNMIILAPFTKFPLVRDLIVDRTVMFDNLIKVRGWIEADGTYPKGPGPKIFPPKQEVMYSLSTCMTCGCCVEACPQSNDKSQFIGPQIISQVRYFNDNPIGEVYSDERLRVLMQEGGIADCGNAQNCVRVCPKNIPLTESIASIGRDVNIQWFHDLFGLEDR